MHKEAPPRWSKALSEWGSLLPRTAQNSFKANFREFPTCEVRRISLLGTSVNKDRRRAKAATPRPLFARYVALTLRRDTTTVRRDDGGLLNARQNAIIGVGRDGSQRGWIESLDGEPDAE